MAWQRHGSDSTMALIAFLVFIMVDAIIVGIQCSIVEGNYYLMSIYHIDYTCGWVARCVVRWIGSEVIVLVGWLVVRLGG